MSLDLLFTLSSIFAALIGLGALFAPAAFASGGSDAATLMMFRGFGGVFIALAILDWMARGAGASRARTGIVLGNIIGFLLAAIFTGLAVAKNGMTWEWVIVVISALLAIGFFFAGMGGMSSGPKTPRMAPATSMPAPSTTAVKTAPQKAAKKAAKKATKKTTKTAAKRRR